MADKQPYRTIPTDKMQKKMHYVSIADDLMRQLESFKPQIVGSVGKKDYPKDIDLLFPEDTEFSDLRNKLEKLGWKLLYADDDNFNGEIFWCFEKRINDDFVGLDVFLGEMNVFIEVTA